MPITLLRDAGRVAAMHDKALGRWIREMVETEVTSAKQCGALDAEGQTTFPLPVSAGDRTQTISPEG